MALEEIEAMSTITYTFSSYLLRIHHGHSVVYYVFITFCFL